MQLTVQDLSERHGPVSDLFRLPSDAGERERFRLSAEQVDFYRENGYLAGIRVLSDEQVEILREELKAIADPEHPGHGLFYEFHSNESATPGDVLFHALGAWRISPGFHDLLWNPAFTVPATQLLGGPVRFWHDQLFSKPAKHGGVVAWHQDYSYWTRTKPLAHITCWIGLDDSTTENGCIHYVPGSHRWKLLPITGLAGDMEAIRKVLTEDRTVGGRYLDSSGVDMGALDRSGRGEERWREFRPVPVELKAGEASFHHALTVHGSHANRSPRPRRAVVINAVLDGVVSDSDDPLLEGVPPIPRGRPLAGRFFPLLTR